MAIGANSYGTVAGVEALARRWTNASKVFDTTTTPTLTQVESWIDQISSVINITMAGCRYTTLPITQATILEMFGLYVEQITADMVEGSHDIGRLGPTALQNTRGRIRTMWRVVAGEVAEFIKDNCDAYEYLGLTRDEPITAVTVNKLKSATTLQTDGYSSTYNNVTSS